MERHNSPDLSEWGLETIFKAQEFVETLVKRAVEETITHALDDKDNPPKAFFAAFGLNKEYPIDSIGIEIGGLSSDDDRPLTMVVSLSDAVADFLEMHCGPGNCEPGEAVRDITAVRDALLDCAATLTSELKRLKE